LPGPLRNRRALAAAATLLAAAAVPVACGESRERARLAALEAGIASAQASLFALSAGAPTPPPLPPLLGGAQPSFRPVGAASAVAATAAGAPFPVGSRPLAASGLLGAEPDALRRWFGDPDLRRPEGDAEVQLYLGPSCALDVVLYAEGGGMRVFHAVARAEGAAAVTEAECLHGIGGGGAGRAAAAGHTGRR
jgi:hypothetical protein